MNLPIASLGRIAWHPVSQTSGTVTSQKLTLYIGTLFLVLMGWKLRAPYLENVSHSDLRYYIGWAYRSTNYGLGSVFGSRRTESRNGEEIVLLRADNPVGHLAIFHALGIAYPWITGEALSLESVAGINRLPETEAKRAGRKLFKLPALIADLLTVGILSLAVGRRWGNAHGLLVGALYAAHPAILQNSAVWGQVDAWHSLAMLIAVAFWSNARWVPGSLALGLALLFKLQAIALLPISVTCLLFGSLAGSTTRSPRWHRLAATVCTTALLTLLVWTPWILSGSGWHILDPYVRAIGQYNYATVHAFNLWWLANDWTAANPFDFSTGADDRLPLATIPGIGFSISYRLAGTILFGMASVRLCQNSLRRNLTSGAIEMAAIGSCLAFFLFATEMHERYLYPAISLVFLRYRPDWRWWLLAGIISVAVTLNQGIYHPPPCGSWLYLLTEWGRPQVILVGNLVAGGLLLTLAPLLFGKVSRPMSWQLLHPVAPGKFTSIRSSD